MGSKGAREIEIVGVAKDVKYSEVKDAIPPVAYLPYRQDKTLGAASFYVATSVPVDQVLPALRRIVAELDINLPMQNVKTMEAQVIDKIGMDRMISVLVAAFAALATLLAAIGLYGVLAFTVQRRTREIGIRLAVGADSAAIRNLVIKEVFSTVVLGVVFGLSGAVALASFAKSFLFEVLGAECY